MPGYKADVRKVFQPTGAQCSFHPLREEVFVSRPGEDVVADFERLFDFHPESVAGNTYQPGEGDGIVFPV